MALRELLLPWTQQPQEAVGVDAEHPRAQGLVAAIPFDRDALGAAISRGLVTPQPTPRGLLLGNFNGSDRVVTTSVPRVAPPFTVSFDLFRGAASAVGVVEALVSQGGATSSGKGWAISLTGGTPLSPIRLTFGGVADYSESARGIAVGELVRITVVVGGGQARYYINGAIDSTRSVSGMQQPSSTLLNVGATHLGSAYTGHLREGNLLGNIHLWGRALADAEVADDYADTWAVYKPARIQVPVSGGGGGAGTLTPQRLDNASTFPAPTVTRGAVTLSPVRADNASIFFAPAVATGALSLQPTRLDNTAGFFTPAVAAGQVTLAAGRVDNAATFFTPSASQGAIPAQSLAPARVDNASTFFAATTSPGAVGLQPARFDNVAAFPAPAVTARNTLQPARFDNASAIFAPGVAVGGLALQPARLDNASAFFGATVRLAKDDVLAPFWANRQAFGKAAILLEIPDPATVAAGVRYGPGFALVGTKRAGSAYLRRR